MDRPQTVAVLSSAAIASGPPDDHADNLSDQLPRFNATSIEHCVSQVGDQTGTAGDFAMTCFTMKILLFEVGFWKIGWCDDHPRFSSMLKICTGRQPTPTPSSSKVAPNWSQLSGRHSTLTACQAKFNELRSGSGHCASGAHKCFKSTKGAAASATFSKSFSSPDTVPVLRTASADSCSASTAPYTTFQIWYTMKLLSCGVNERKQSQPAGSGHKDLQQG